MIIQYQECQPYRCQVSILVGKTMVIVYFWATLTGGGGEEHHSILVPTLNRQTMKPRVF